MHASVLSAAVIDLPAVAFWWVGYKLMRYKSVKPYHDVGFSENKTENRKGLNNCLEDISPIKMQ